MIKSELGKVEIKGTVPELFADTCVLLKSFSEQKIFSKREISDMFFLSVLSDSTLGYIQDIINAIDDEDV